MPKSNGQNTIYISERLQESLRPISGCALTTVVAPMGYGKTTAVNWYLAERAKAPGTTIIRVSVYSDNLAIFWKSVQDAFSHAGLDILENFPCPSDAAGASLLSDALCHEFEKGSFYLFVDDFHLLTDDRLPGFIVNLSTRLPSSAHLIIASRDRFLSGGEILRLGHRGYMIGVDKLRLNHTELSVYAHRFGADLTDDQIDSLLSSSEGWFSAVYLGLRAVAERGSLPDNHSDIYDMFSAAMIDPLSENQREFLAVMGLADEFTAGMAAFVSDDPDTDSILRGLTERNAFVTRLYDGKTFRFHHMMKECAKRTFLTLPEDRRKTYLGRLGKWYEDEGKYLHALSFYSKSEDYDSALRVITSDAGILLASLKPSDVLSFLDKCPKKILLKNPLTILVLMRSMFNWRLIPKMTQMRGLLDESIAAHPGMSETERGNLLGERDLIMSFLSYNDISAMSRLHRSASEQMSRPAISIRSDGGWTFGSPSVLMMFHRENGNLDRELAEMNECMPHYYRITNGHGQGAEKIMTAEAAAMRGDFTGAAITLESAFSEICGNGQENMALCGEFLALRLSLRSPGLTVPDYFERRAALLEKHNLAWLNILDSAFAYFHAISGSTGKIPDIFASHRLSSINFLAPGKPMIDMIENQVYLAEGEYAKVAGQSERLLQICGGLHYALVALHIKLQTASAYEMLGMREKALETLKDAISDAVPDGILLPFAENRRYLGGLFGYFTEGVTGDFIKRVKALPDGESGGLPEELSVLTERELEIVKLAAERLSNRDIAEKLFLSEGSVKQYMNQIYSKLQISGDTRTKRKRLSGMLNPDVEG